MAYSEQACSLITDLPALIRSFATDRGWTVAGNSITAPGGGIEWDITALIAANGFHSMTIKDVANPTTRVSRQFLPRLQGTINNPVVLNPTKVHLFGNDAPYEMAGQAAPYIAGVIECGYNYYRHFYIGKLRRAGNYTGGDIVCQNQYNQTRETINYYDPGNKHMFAASHSSAASVAGQPNCGGVLVTHADCALPWKNFDGPTGGSGLASMAVDTVFGGAGDGPGDGLLRRSVSAYAGATILVPYNLFTIQDGTVGANFRVRPLGVVNGARMVDMRSLMPGVQIDVGNVPWRVFPEFRREPTKINNTINNPGYYIDGENSGLQGIAYAEE